VCLVRPFPLSSLSPAVLPYEQVYLDNLPSASMYEKSYMHRETVSFVGVSSYAFF